VTQLPHLASWVACASGLFVMGSLCLGFRPYCFRASVVVVWLPLMSCNWVLVACCVRAMLVALLRVKVESYSRSFDWTRALFDPKIRASLMCSSGFVNLHSDTRTRTSLELNLRIHQGRVLGCGVCSVRV